MIRRYKWPLIAVIGTVIFGLVWFLMTGPRPMMLPGQADIVGFSADGRALATIDQDGKACLWDPETGQSLKDLAGELADLPFPFSPDGRYHLARESKDIRSRRVLVDTKSGKSILRFVYPETARFYKQLAFGFARAGRYFSAPTHTEENGHAMSVWRLPEGEQVFSQTNLVALSMSPDGQKFAVSSINENFDAKKIELLSIRDRTAESTLDKTEYHVMTSQSVAFSSAGDHLVVCSDGGNGFPSTVTVLDIETKQVLAEHEIRSHALCGPRFIRDDHLIAVDIGIDGGPIAILLANTDQPGVAWKVDALSSNLLWGVTAAKTRDELSEWLEINVFKISSNHAPRITNASPFVKLKFPIDQWGYRPRCSISNDGERVAVAFQYGYSESSGMSNSTMITVVDVPSKQVILRYRSKDHAHNVHFSPDGRFIAFENSVLSPGVGVIRIPDQN
jgi:WD40 repeat protein